MTQKQFVTLWMEEAMTIFTNERLCVLSDCLWGCSTQSMITGEPAFFWIAISKSEQLSRLRNLQRKCTNNTIIMHVLRNMLTLFKWMLMRLAKFDSLLPLTICEERNNRIRRIQNAWKIDGTPVAFNERFLLPDQKM